MRGILVGLLSEAGYRVTEAASGEQALTLFAAAPPALTISDIALGRMDGIELLGRVKQVDPEALVIMITAYSSVETAIAALRRGAYDYITKPFINEDILQTVRNAHFSATNSIRLCRNGPDRPRAWPRYSSSDFGVIS